MMILTGDGLLSDWKGVIGMGGFGGILGADILNIVVGHALDCVHRRRQRWRLRVDRKGVKQVIVKSRYRSSQRTFNIVS